MSKSFRIAFLLSSLKFGGGERVALNLAAALKEEGYEIDFLLMSHEGEFLEEAQSQFNVVDLCCERTWKLPLKLGIYLNRNQPVALISSFWKLNLCACLSRFIYPKVKLIVWEHSPPSRSINSPTWLYAISASALYQVATRVVAVSSGVASDVLRITIGLRRKVLTIFNPIPAIPSVLNRPGRAGGNRIVWVGRLDDPKNPGLMLEAFSLLPKDRGFLLNFVGDGKLRSELEQRARELGIAQSVKFLGFQKDPYACMVDADLLVLTSDREGLPSVLVEALYAGLQIVSTDCGQGIYDILLNNRYGTIVPTNDKYSLAKAIELEISKPSDKYAQIAGAERFQPREIARQFLNALHISKS